MPARSALNSLVSRIRTKLHNRSLAMYSRGTGSPEPASFDSHDSMESLKHNPRSRQASMPSICSFVRHKCAMGLSKVMARTRDRSQTITEPVNTDARKQRLPQFTNVFTRLPQTNHQTSNNEKSNQQYHYHSSLPVCSQVPPLLVAKDQSEASDATKSPSITWHARPPGMDGTSPGMAQLIVQPSKSPWGRDIFATSVVPNGLKWDSLNNGRSISKFLDQVHEEEKTTRTGPFWDRKYRDLNEAVTEVMERNERSRKSTPGDAWIGVREGTQKFSASYVLKEDCKHFGREVKYLWDTHLRPVTKCCLSSVQSRR
jgi:hypothetical protein